MGRLKRLTREIHERSLWQALVVYLGASFAVLEAVDLLLIEYFGLPRWLFLIAFVLLLVGLPLVVMLSLSAEEKYGADVPPGQEAVAAEEDRRLRRLTWRTAGQAFVGALALWGVVLTGWVFFGDRMATPSAANRVVVFPFTYRGNEEWAYLGEGMVDLLSKTLDGAGELRTVGPRAVLGILEQAGDDATGSEGGRSVAERLNAGQYVEGEIVEAGGRLQVSARLCPSDVVEECVQVSVEGDPDSSFALVDDLTAQLLVGAEQEGIGRLVRVAAVTTDSLAALKAYLEGERLFRLGMEGREGAYHAFQRAVEIDSTFALAWYRLSQLGYYSGESLQTYVTAAETAIQFEENLPWRERRLLEAHFALTRGAAAEAERVYREILDTHPDDVEVWFGLVMTLGGWWYVLGTPLSAARQPIKLVLSYEPSNYLALWWLFLLEADAGNWPRVDTVFPRLFRDEPPWTFRAVRAFGSRDPDEQQQVLRAAREQPYHSPLVVAADWVSGFGHNPRGALEFVRNFEGRAEAPDLRALAQEYLAFLDFSLGRWRAARERYRHPSYDRNWAIADEAYWWLAAHLPVDRVQLGLLRDSIARWDTGNVPDVVPSIPFLKPWVIRHNGVQPQLRHYLLGRLSARLGDHEEALRYAAELEAMESPPRTGTISQDLAHGIRAFVFTERGQFAEALKALDRAPREVSWERRGDWFFHEPQERFLRAQLLEELGRDEEALRWYQSISYWPEPSLAGPSHLKQAEVLERLGRPEEAAIQYRRFIDLWSECDPELRPMVEAAQRALERLAGEPTTD